MGPEKVDALIGRVSSTKATKGLLVTTSKFGRESEKRAEEAGNVELVDSRVLKFMMDEMGEPGYINNEEARALNNTPQNAANIPRLPTNMQSAPSSSSSSSSGSSSAIIVDSSDEE